MFWTHKCNLMNILIRHSTTSHSTRRPKASKSKCQRSSFKHQLLKTSSQNKRKNCWKSVHKHSPLTQLLNYIHQYMYSCTCRCLGRHGFILMRIFVKGGAHVVEHISTSKCIHTHNLVQHSLNFSAGIQVKIQCTHHFQSVWTNKLGFSYCTFHIYHNCGNFHSC